MSFLQALGLWLLVSAIVVGTFAFLSHRAERIVKRDAPVGIHNLPRPANDCSAVRKSIGLSSRAASVGVLVLAFSAGYSRAQTLALPPLHITAPDEPSCVDVQVEGARRLSYDCLNQQLKDASQAQGNAPPTVTARDVTGTGAPTTVGTFSYTGTSIRMGNAFGKSAIPQRSPAPSFTNALIPSGAK